MIKFPRIRRVLPAVGFMAIVLLGMAWLLISLRPAGAAAPSSDGAFIVVPGAGLRDVATALEAEGFIRSGRAFEIYMFLSGRAHKIQPGHYQLNHGESGNKISEILTAGVEREATVTIPEGMTSFDIDRILSTAGITAPGAFSELVAEQGLEGMLFPDTYRFYYDSSPQEVVDRFLENFERKADPLLAEDPENYTRNLILASILEKEVPEDEDRRIVAGLLIKRIKAGMPLQVDASICYAKEVLNPDDPCEPISKLDKKIASPYNTYLHSGWPPGAISNPGVLAISAAMQSKDSPYWFYLSEPVEGKTIFARTIEEQVMNQLKYLQND